jgi:hypothetical protein
MSLNRYAVRRDISEPPIIEALERAGAEVWPLDYPVDLLVRFRGHWHLLECKTGRGKKLTVARDKRQKEQIAFLESTQTPIVRTPMEALRAIGAVSPQEFP